MARVVLVLDFPNTTVDELRALVVANDTTASGAADAIRPDAVRAEAVVLDWARGEMNMGDGEVVEALSGITEQ